jgi:hypothetical protein
MTRGGPLVGVRLWYGAPLDPATGDEMDRMWRWNAQANGDWVDLERVWPKCAGDPISADEYAYLCERTAYARRNDAFDPMAQPRRRTDWDTSTIPTF